VEPAEDTRMADYDWSSVARRYLDLYNTAVRPTKRLELNIIEVDTTMTVDDLARRVTDALVL
jgi:hypothetical protein